MAAACAWPRRAAPTQRGRAEVAACNQAVLDTPRLRLRPMEARDEAMFCHLYTDPDVMRRIVAPLSAEAARLGFQRACRQNAKVTPGHRYWAIDDKTADTAIGMAALLRTGDSAELGVMLRNGWWNRGVSSEAFVPLIDHAFSGMDLTLVYAQRPDDDHALIIDRLLGRFGFVRTPDKVEDPTLCRWELPRAQWQGRQLAGRSVSTPA
ncbi:GNAT family N-acetyltransferase [Lysobacter niabensis]|uniref:GNAT family N-acetyltransferase n=1 Tax=Agrilutibacter niabensis TaxID=380628 RepID=UPI00360986A8